MLTIDSDYLGMVPVLPLSHPLSSPVVNQTDWLCLYLCYFKNKKSCCRGHDPITIKTWTLQKIDLIYIKLKKKKQKWSESLFYFKWKLISGVFCKYIILIITKKTCFLSFIFQMIMAVCPFPTGAAVVQMQRGALDNPLIISCIGIL